MAEVKNLIHETTISTGTTTLTLVAVNGRVRFSDSTYGFGTGGTDVFYYFISNRNAAEWEFGTGHMSDANTLVRDTVIASSNADAAVNFSVGTKDVTNGLPAANRVTIDDIGVTVQGFDADTLKADTADVLTAGFATTVHNAGTQSSGTYTPDEADGNFQRAVNGGAHTLAPPSNDCNIVVQYTNNASAGTITTSGFTQVTGDAFSTTNGDDFLAYITKINGFSHLNVVALQ